MTREETVSSPSLTCPSCGNDGTHGAIRYLVDVVSFAEVIALDEGVLRLAGPLSPTMQDPHARPRFECWAVGPSPANRVCGRRWPVPDGIVRVAWQVRS